VPDVSPRVRDVMASSVISVGPKTTVAEALGLMEDRGIRVLPVLNEDRTCEGLLSLFKMSKFFFPTPNRPFDSRKVLATLLNLACTVDAEMVYAVDPDREEELVLMVGAMSPESFVQRLRAYEREKLIVIVGDRRDIQSLAIREKVRVVLVTGGLAVDSALIEEAKRNKVSLLISPHDSATTAMLSRASITVDHMIHRDFLAFRDEEQLASVRAQASTSNFQAFPVVDDKGRTVGILSKSDFLRPVERKLILVDHNELSQAVHGADEVEIVEVVDHHRIGLTTQQPILFRNEPVGSTSTIVARCFLSHGIEMPASIAGVLLAGLVSDTLNLTSPTTTELDREVLGKLEAASGVSAREFTEKLFASGSVLVSRPAEQAVTTDCKEYVEQGRRFSVAQIEEIGFTQFWNRKSEVVGAVQRYCAENGYYLAALLVTDIVSQSSLLVVSAPDPFQNLISYPEVEDGIFKLEGVVSRKKQLLPFLTHCLAQLK
jgi:manganese-dependent inorganic pyrophosphatase